MDPRTRWIAAATIAALATPLGSAGADDWRAERERERLEQDKTIAKSDMVTWDPEPGRDQVGPMKPAWCDLDDRHAGEVTGSYLERTLEQMKERGWHEDHTAKAAAALCAHPEARDWQVQTGHFVQGYVNMTGLSKKDAIAAIRARVDQDTWASEKEAFCATLEVSEEASPETKRLNKARREVFGCTRGGIFWRDPQRSLGDELEWYIDKRADISSEILASYWVLSCLNGGWGLSTKDKDMLTPYALCGIDARSLDRSALVAELGGGDYNRYAKVVAHETLAYARASEQRYRAVIDQLAKSDPEYQRIFIDIPEATWKKWVAGYEANRARYEAAYDFEAKLYGPSRKALKGCLAPLRQHFTSYVKAGAPTAREDFEARATDAVGAALLNALLPCAAAGDGNYWETHAYAELLNKARDVRGPRFAVFYAVIDAVQAIREDRTRFPLEPTSFGYKTKVSTHTAAMNLLHDRYQGTASQDAVGVVARTVKSGDKVTIHFKTEKWQEEVLDCKSTGRIRGISSSGTIEYYEDCAIAGYKTVKHTEKKTVIPAYAAAGIKRGALVRLSADYPYDAADYERHGFPIEVFANKQKKKTTAMFGIGL